MPVYDQSYRRWGGKLLGRPARVFAIWRAATVPYFQKRLLLVILFLSQIWPLIGIAIVWVFSNRSQNEFLQQFADGAARFFKVSVDMSGTFLFVFTLYFWLQFFTFLLALWIGSGQIAGDKRNHALPLYFARAISPWDYIVGKGGAVFVSVWLLNALPVLLLLLCHIFMSSDWGFPLREMPTMGAAVLVPLIVAAVYTLVVLACSSVTRSTFLASFLFVGVMFVMPVVSRILYAMFKSPWTTYLSIPDSVKRVAAALYDFQPPDLAFFNKPLWEANPWICGIVLVLACLGSLWVLRRNLKPVEIIG